MEIVTPRLIVRSFRAEDVQDFYVYQALPEVRRFMSLEAKDLEKAEAFVRRQAEMSSEIRDAYHAFAVVLRDQPRVIGDVGVYLPSGEERIGDLGFQFDPEFQGKGYAFESASALVQYAFTEWKLDRITSHCDPRNERSYRLMERLSMTREVSEGDGLAYALSRTKWLLSQG